jgi:hypothetical protein
VSFHLAPDDARRGGLVILGADAVEGEGLARRYAEGGYETVVVGANDAVEVLIKGLAAPVFVLALPDAAVAAWSLDTVAAVSIVGDTRIETCVGRPPAVPVILHLDPAAHAELAAAFEAAQPDLPVHARAATDDGDRLLLLRTLRLFSRTGGRGEV